MKKATYPLRVSVYHYLRSSHLEFFRISSSRHHLIKWETRLERAEQSVDFTVFRSSRLHLLKCKTRLKRAEQCSSHLILKDNAWHSLELNLTIIWYWFKKKKISLILINRIFLARRRSRGISFWQHSFSCWDTSSSKENLIVEESNSSYCTDRKDKSNIRCWFNDRVWSSSIYPLLGRSPMEVGHTYTVDDFRCGLDQSRLIGGSKEGF